MEQIVQRTDEIASDRAAQATVFEHDDGVVGGGIELVVEADFTELVDDDDRLRQFRRLQGLVDQRRLATAEEAGDEGHRNPAREFGIHGVRLGVHHAVLSEDFTTRQAAGDEAVGREVGDDLAAVLGDNDLFLDARRT